MTLDTPNVHSRSFEGRRVFRPDLTARRASLRASTTPAASDPPARLEPRAGGAPRRPTSSWVTSSRGAADAASPRTRRRACFARSRPAPSPPPRASARESPRSSASTSSTAVREDAPRTRHRRRCASRAPRMRGARSSAYKTGTADRLETTNRRDAGPAPDETRGCTNRASSPRRFPLRRRRARGAAVEATEEPPRGLRHHLCGLCFETWRRDERAKHAPPPGVTTHPDRQCDPNQHPRAAHQRERLGFHSTGGLDARRRVFVCRVFVRKRSAFRPSSRRPVRCGRCLLSSLDGFAHRSVSSLVVVYVHHPKRRSFRRRRARFRLAGQARLGEKRRNRRSPTDDII